MPEDYCAGDKNLYVTALEQSRTLWSPDGRMPDGSPEFVLNVQQQFNDNGKGKAIDVKRTYTTEFVDKVS
jgi:NitT/TauT family transport system substrate-binding protein